MIFGIGNNKQLNTFIKSLGERLNKLNKSASDIDRHDLEEIVSPIISNGKTHPVLVAEMKKAPRKNIGVLSRKGNRDFSNNLSNLNTEVEQYLNYKSDLSSALEHTAKHFSNEGFNEWLEEQPQQVKAVNLFRSLTLELLGENLGQTFEMSINGLDESTERFEGGAESYNVTVELNWKENSISFNAVVISGSFIGMSVESIDCIKLCGIDLDMMIGSDITPEMTEGVANEIYSGIEDELSDWLGELVTAGTPDLSGKISSKVSPELLSRLIDELS
ncbi:hypothetical protein VCHA53O466_40465 [Vibrio chagasii]|nr:hypothetical protein VCHA53O466_40465 [Vibrio chagasii]